MSSPRKKILYITNNEFSYRLVKRLLSSHDIDVHHAEDGLIGIKKAIDGTFDLILLELHLPYLDGLSVATRLRGNHKTQKTPIIAFTSRVSKGEQEKVLVSGCSGYIEKPLSPKTFHKKIKEIMEGSIHSTPDSGSSQILRTYNAELVAKLQHKIIELKAKNELLIAHQEALQGAYKKTRESHAELERLAKLKQHIVAITSHELRTPLSVSTGYIDALKEQCFGPINEEQATASRLALEGMKKISSLINRITDLNRVTHQKFPMKLEAFDLNTLVKANAKDLKLMMDLREMTLELQLSPDPIPIRATESAMNQIIMNLLRNALSYTRDRGHIIIKTWVEEQDAMCSVKDSGIGIPENELENVFEAFYQLEDFEHHKSDAAEFMTRGVGVGLALCRGLLRELGGRIWAESLDEQKGSTLTFSVPLDKI